MAIQVIFYWTLLARQISQYFDANPSEKPMVKSRKNEQSQIVLSPQQEQHIREVFELFDTDGGGTIDRQELRVAMCALGFEGSETSNPSRGVKGRSIDGSETLTLEEFTTLMKGELLLADPLEEIRAIFAAVSGIEKGGDSTTISLGKLRLAAQKYQIRLSEDELQLMMMQVDEDAGGTVDEQEFIRVISFSHWF